MDLQIKPRPSEGQKFREKRAQQAAEREQRIQEEKSTIVDPRVVEDQQLNKKLVPLGFGLKEIKPDGHCLYRAVRINLLCIQVPVQYYLISNSGNWQLHTCEVMRKIFYLLLVETWRERSRAKICSRSLKHIAGRWRQQHRGVGSWSWGLRLKR